MQDVVDVLEGLLDHWSRLPGILMGAILVDFLRNSAASSSTPMYSPSVRRCAAWPRVGSACFFGAMFDPLS
jgi:hypothetical protein